MHYMLSLNAKRSMQCACCTRDITIKVLLKILLVLFKTHYAIQALV
jgi:hypothetical protein